MSATDTFACERCKQLCGGAGAEWLLEVYLPGYPPTIIGLRMCYRCHNTLGALWPNFVDLKHEKLLDQTQLRLAQVEQKLGNVRSKAWQDARKAEKRIKELEDELRLEREFAKEKKLRRQRRSRAHTEGYLAFIERQSRDANPYDIFRDEEEADHIGWEDGWMEAEHEREGLGVGMDIVRMKNGTPISWIHPSGRCLPTKKQRHLNQAGS